MKFFLWSFLFSVLPLLVNAQTATGSMVQEDYHQKVFKLKELYVNYLSSESCKKQKQAFYIYTAKANFLANKKAIKMEANNDIHTWVRNNFDKTFFESLKEEDSLYINYSDAIAADYKENKEFHAYLLDILLSEDGEVVYEDALRQIAREYPNLIRKPEEELFNRLEH
ncbi:hypothetical protein [Flavobacterium rhizosphaerae]|uniref:Uncharacterized protein n=1 Tax=Flavobacterium rhizosphaerae TaxID=3163298 RepID=A0ABW8Z139_9FLAO